MLPFLLILLFLTFEVGRALYQYNVLTKSVRDAVRYLSVQSQNTKIAEAKNIVVYGNLTGGDTPLVYGLSVDQIPDPKWKQEGASPVINTVTIKIGKGEGDLSEPYTFTPIFGNFFGLEFPPITFPPISATMRVQL